jgi:hypothetical protein
MTVNQNIVYLDPGTRIHFRGFDYTRNRIAQPTVKRPYPISYFRCSKSQSVDCNARLIVPHIHTLPFEVEEKGAHTCAQTVAQSTNIIDVQEEMKNLAAAKALGNIALRPAEIWAEVMDDIMYAHPNAAYRTLSKQQLISYVYKVRRDQFGSGWVDMIESPPAVIVSENDGRPFLQFNANIGVKSVMHRFIGWSHPDLVHIARYPKRHLFLDATFRCVPAGFAQCLIIMILDAASDVYVPVFYVLMEGKSVWDYWIAINQVLISTELKMEPASVTCDFERSLINAVEEQFGGVPIVGCLFHWKQAIGRKMKKMGLPQQHIQQLMAPGALDILTVIPVDEIETIGILYVRSLINEAGCRTSWDGFWKYFKDTWMQKYRPQWWNINELSSEEDDIQNRTNNPLESYNRILNTVFPTPHPSLAQFIEVIKQQSIGYVHKLYNIRMRREERPNRVPFVYPPIPPHYIAFRQAHMHE